MATIPTSLVPPDLEYPDSDGQPMAETPQHRDNLAFQPDGMLCTRKWSWPPSSLTKVE